MPAKVKSKGTAILMSISAVYTAIPQVKGIDVTGQKGITYNSTCLDGPVTETNDATGFVSAPTIKFDYYHDFANAVHTALQGFCDTPVNTNFKITYADSGPTSEIYACTAGGLDKKVQTSDGLLGSCELQTSGNRT